MASFSINDFRKNFGFGESRYEKVSVEQERESPTERWKRKSCTYDLDKIIKLYIYGVAAWLIVTIIGLAMFFIERRNGYWDEDGIGPFYFLIFMIFFLVLYPRPILKFA